MPKHGHLPGHLRDCFLTAIVDFYQWWKRDDRSPPPNVTLEVHCEPHEISLERACGLLWFCTDALPGFEFEIVEEIAEYHAFPFQVGTYAAAARVIKAALALRDKRLIAV
jgi:hypothetical protein